MDVFSAIPCVILRMRRCLLRITNLQKTFLFQAIKCQTIMYAFLVSVLALLAVARYTRCAEEETITGTIFSNNNSTLYIDGELVAIDPVPIAPHQAYNVSFNHVKGKDITFAMEGIDFYDVDTGLELDNRCVGAGGLRAMFSNGVVTNSSWKCRTYHYGPVNWKQCFAAEGRPGALKVLPACLFNVTVEEAFDSGCFARTTPIPDGWTEPDFDDSGWEYATVWDDEYARPFIWIAFPEGCRDPNTYISTEQDASGENMTCPSNLDWGASKFIWRPDIDLDNHILCRYTMKVASGSPQLVSALSLAMMLLVSTIAATLDM